MQKNSIHIGLNVVDPSNYGGWDGRLNGCVNDSNSLAAAFLENGYLPFIMHNQDATKERVLDLITTILNKSKSGDRLVVTFSCHGTQQIDVSGDEKDGKDEALCLYDGLLIDDDFNAVLNRAKRGVQVLVLSDSCHSGSVIRDGRIAAKSRSAPENIAKLFNWATKTVDRITRRKSITLLSSCKDNEVSYEVGGGGVFTSNIIRILKEKGNISVRRLHRILKKDITDYQTPKLTSLGYRTVERTKFF